MTYYLVHCSSYQNIQKMDRLRVQAFDVYYSDFFITVIEDSENKGLLISDPVDFFAEVSDYLYIIRILSMSRLKKVDLIYFIFPFIFYFLFNF